MGPQPKQVRARSDQNQTDTLCSGEPALPQYSVDFMAPQELYEKSSGRIEHQIPAQHLPIELFLAILRIEEQKDDELGGGFIKLRRMQRHIERDTYRLVAVRIRERDSPGERRRQAPAAARRETAKAPRSEERRVGKECR